ncbi:integrase [Gossypium australe]|uniref:Integrase n=1 Tax=Gossypium australe TaxID=47621 RepID=A0A5B6WU71_9ROSI|nr:integrase [Gossypium australe]
MYNDSKKICWQPEMKCDVSEFTCQQAKAEHQLVTIPEQKWDKVTMNFILGLPLSLKKKNATWVIVDHLTKLAHFILMDVSPWKKVLRFGCKSKLSLQFIGPYDIIENNQTCYSCIYATTFDRTYSDRLIEILASEVKEMKNIKKKLPVNWRKL